MFALISPNESRGQYQRIAELTDEPFDVAEPMHWVAAPVGTTLCGHAYDPETQAVVSFTPETAVDKEDLVASIDDAVAAIYARYNRFQAEYTEREAQAQDYKNAGYTGDVPVQVAAFATPAGKTGQQAADIILSQAAQLRGALSQLGVLRMRKYEVLAAPDAAAAQAIADAILGAVAQIGSAL